MKLTTQNRNAVRRNISRAVVLAFVVEVVLFPIRPALGQEATSLRLPGQMVSESLEYFPAVLRGLQYFPDDPLKFNFIIDAGDEDLAGESLKNESSELIKYFLASLTVPDENMWVNLSPTEKDRMIPDGFGSTKMGMTLLAQDYLLKQLAASLTNPETDLGKTYWDNAGSGCDHSLQNRVWIVPDIAKIYRQQDKVFVAQAHLKVMLAEDRSLDGQQSVGVMASRGALSTSSDVAERSSVAGAPATAQGTSQIFRATILPIIEKQVNEGKDFAPLRQVYHSLILAVWFKKHLRESFLGKNYAQKNKIDGVETDDLSLKEKIYGEYLQSFEKGIYNIIKEEVDPLTQEMIPRKYFSGGIDATNLVTGVDVAGSSLEVKSAQKGRAYEVLTYLGLNRESKNRSFVAALSVSLLFHLSLLAWGPPAIDARPIESAPRLEAVLASLPDLKKSDEQQGPNSTDQKEPKPLIMRIDGKPLEFYEGSLQAPLATIMTPQEGADPKNPFGLSEEQLKASPHALVGANGEVVEVPIGQVGVSALTRESTYVPPPVLKEYEPPPVYSYGSLDRFAPTAAGFKPITIAQGKNLAMEPVKGLKDTYEVAVRGIGTLGDMANRLGIWKEHPEHQGNVVSPQKADELLTRMGDINSVDFGVRKESLFTAYNFTADELARFFNQAGQQLTPKEKEFRDFLEKNGAIKKQGGQFVGGQDVNILVHPNDLSEADERTAREHEKGHALYEQDKQYQKAVSNVKDKLTADQKEFLKKLLMHMGYHEVSHDREFAEYFTDTELLIAHLRRIFKDQYDRNQSPETRARARELAAKMFEERAVSKRESGQFFKDFMKEFLNKTMLGLVQAKRDAQKRAGIDDAEAKPAEMSFLNTNIIPHFDPGGIGLSLSRVEVKSFEGNKEEIIKRLAQAEQKVSAQDQKQALADLERYIKDQGYTAEDVFALRQDYFENGAWDINLVRKQGEVPLQKVVERKLAQVPVSERNNAQSILKAVREVLSQKSYAFGESLSVRVLVNVAGESLELAVYAYGTHNRSWQGQTRVRAESLRAVTFSLNYPDRLEDWGGNLDVYARGENFSQAFDGAFGKLDEKLKSRGIGSMSPVSQTRNALTLEQILAERFNGVQRVYPQQSLDFLMPVDIGGEVWDLHIVQNEKRDGFETRLAIEIPGTGETLGSLGVRVDTTTAREGFQKAVVELRRKIKDKPPASASAKSASSALDAEAVGGIDFNPQNWQIEEQEQLKRPALSQILFDPETSTLIPFSGITPFIIQTTPVSLPLLLGFSSSFVSEDTSLAQVP